MPEEEIASDQLAYLEELEAQRHPLAIAVKGVLFEKKTPREVQHLVEFRNTLRRFVFFFDADVAMSSLCFGL